MKKIIISLAVIGVVSAIVIGGTVAYFSDTETSGRNLFKAGTIDIQIEDDEGNFVWSGGATLDDMKPSYTDYINFTIHNDGSDANPVNVWKKLRNFVQTTGTVSEPECTDQGGTWTSGANQPCNWNGNDDRDNIASIIEYDLSVIVYDASNAEIWWQAIYDKEVTVGQIAGSDMYLGMIPAGGYMEVTQSYHMKDPDWPTNWAQGDEMAFDIEIKAIQLRGTAWLENKTGDPDWKIIQGDGIQGTLTYKVKNPTFDFEFIGKAPLTNHGYVLAIGYDGNTNVDTEIGTGITDGSGDITIIGDVELSSDMKDVKVWLIPEENWNSGIDWGGGSGWPGMVSETLWETGLIWYEDTDL